VKAEMFSMTKLKAAQLKARCLGIELSEADYQHWKKVDNVECLLKILYILHHNIKLIK